MLGSDPVYQYDFGMDRDSGAAGVQGVITLEPVYCGNSGLPSSSVSETKAKSQWKLSEKLEDDTKQHTKLLPRQR